MGWNTTVVVMHDALAAIREDPQFCENLYQAIISGDRPYDVPARSHGLVHVNAAVVVESHHSEHDVLVKVGGNTGVVIDAHQNG